MMMQPAVWIMRLLRSDAIGKRRVGAFAKAELCSWFGSGRERWRASWLSRLYMKCLCVGCRPVVLRGRRALL